MGSLEFTIHLSPDELDFAKEYAQSRGLTVEELFDRYLKLLRERSTSHLHPDIEKYSGIIPSDINAERLYKERQLQKHQ